MLVLTRERADLDIIMPLPKRKSAFSRKVRGGTKKKSTSSHVQHVASSPQSENESRSDEESGAHEQLRENEIRNDEESEAGEQVPKAKVAKKSKIELTVKRQQTEITNLKSKYAESQKKATDAEANFKKLKKETSAQVQILEKQLEKSERDAVSNVTSAKKKVAASDKIVVNTVKRAAKMLGEEKEKSKKKSKMQDERTDKLLEEQNIRKMKRMRKIKLWHYLFTTLCQTRYIH